MGTKCESLTFRTILGTGLTKGVILWVKTALYTLGMTAKGIYVLFPNLKVLTLPSKVVEIDLERLWALVASLTGMYLIPPITTGLLALPVYGT